MLKVKIFFIVNPVAGRRKNPKRLINLIRKVCREAGVEFAIRIWERPDQIAQLVDVAKTGNYNRVVAVGGDGTVNAIGKLLIGTDIAMGIVASGSGNGFAHHLGFSRKIGDAIRQNLDGRIEKIDTGVFGGIPFLNSAGIGMDAEVAERFHVSKSRGLRTYIKLSTQTLFKFRSFPVTIDIDGTKMFWKKVYFVDIANGTEWGSGAKISPLSKLADGTLTSVVVPQTLITRVPKMLNQLFNGRLDKNRNVKMIPGKKFTINRAAAGVAHVDGDPVYLPAEIECEIKPNSLFVVVPPLKMGV